jgi:hypothetical protein
MPLPDLSNRAAFRFRYRLRLELDLCGTFLCEHTEIVVPYPWVQSSGKRLPSSGKFCEARLPSHPHHFKPTSIRFDRAEDGR